MRRLAKVLVLLAIVALPATAGAGPTEEARQHFDRALELVDDGQFAEAIVEFGRCYELKPHFAVFYNIGQAYISLAKPVEASTALRRYLDEGGSAISAERRAAVEQEIARQRGRIAELELRVTPEGAMVSVDGKDVGRAPLGASVPVGVGSHTVSVSQPGYRSAETTVEVAGLDHKVVTLALVELPKETTQPTRRTQDQKPAPHPLPSPKETTQPTRPSTPLPPAPARTQTAAARPGTAEPTSGWSALKGVGLVGMGTGLLGLGAATTFWVLANTKHNQALTDWNADDFDSARTRQRDAEDMVTRANVGFVAGGTLLAAGAVLYFAAPTSRRAPVAWPSIGPGSAGLWTQGVW